MSTLIVYATKHGCAKRCANLIANNLNDKADLVDLKKSKAPDLASYDKVIIGGSIYVGKVQKEITSFCTKHLNELLEKKIGLFVCGMAEGADQTKEIDSNFPKALLDAAVAKEFLGGEFLIDEMGFLEKAIIKKISNVTTNQTRIQTDSIQKISQAMN